MALCCAALKRDSVSLFVFPLLGHVQAISRPILPVYRLKYSLSCFLRIFLFEILLLCVFMLTLLLLATVISFSLLFSLQFSSLLIVASTQSLMLSSTLPLLDTYFLSISSVGFKVLCIVINFLVLGSFCLSFPPIPCTFKERSNVSYLMASVFNIFSFL